jgi:uncharacterized protein YycO
MKKRSPARLIFYSLLAALFVYAGYLSTLNQADLPPLKDGDLVFQSTWVPGSMAIGLASGSIYIHTGIIKHTDNGVVVIQASSTVTETPLDRWIDQGVLGRFALYRYKDLSQAQATAILSAAKAYYGKPYDHFFSFDNDAIYCSELDYLAFKDAGVSLGKVEQIGSLGINNRFVRKLIEQRWQYYPACAGKGYNFETCYDVIMNGKLITPASIAADPHLERIFSNYPW